MDGNIQNWCQARYKFFLQRGKINGKNVNEEKIPEDSTFNNGDGLFFECNLML